MEEVHELQGEESPEQAGGLQPGPPETGISPSKERQDELIDEAVEQSFPASDPPGSLDFG